LKIRPSPTEEEAAAIVAALETLQVERREASSLKRNRWRLAGLLGHALEPGIELDGSLWSYSGWKGMA
jgi:hypothetical protein